MCLAAPVKIVEIREDGTALVHKEGVAFAVSYALYPDLKAGDYVLVHAGFIIQKIDEREAGERLELIDELYRSES